MVDIIFFSLEIKDLSFIDRHSWMYDMLLQWKHTGTHPAYSTLAGRNISDKQEHWPGILLKLVWPSNCITTNTSSKQTNDCTQGLTDRFPHNQCRTLTTSHLSIVATSCTRGFKVRILKRSERWSTCKTDYTVICRFELLIVIACYSKLCNNIFWIFGN